MIYMILTVIFGILTVLSSYSSICLFTHSIVNYDVHPETIAFGFLSFINGYLAIKQSFKNLPLPESKEKEPNYLVAEDTHEGDLG